MATTSANPVDRTETCSGRKTEHETTTCPECNSGISGDGTESVCESCGLVVESDPIDRGPEYRIFHASDKDSRSRTSTVDRDRHDRGLGSDLHHGRGRSRQERRLDKINRHAKQETKKDRNRGDGTSQIQRIGTALEVPDTVIKQAKTLFRQLHENDSVHCLDTYAAATVYTACRANELGRTPTDIAEHAHVDEKAIARHHRRLSNELGIPTPPPSPAQRVRVVGGSLSVSDTVRETALGILETLSDHERRRGSPSTLAAAALYLASDRDGEGKSQGPVAEAAGCSVVSLRNRMEDIDAAER